MNIKYLPILFIVLISGLASCKKQYHNPDPAIGKWQEVKFRAYGINGSVAYDTTYYQPFGVYDYLQFNGDGTIVISNGYNYFPNLPAYPKKPQQVTPNSFKMNWTNVGSGYVITEIPSSGPPPPGIPPSADTAFLSLKDTQRFQTIGPFHTPTFKTVTEAYYVKK